MKPHLRLIQFIGLIVPQRLRADWRQEWEADQPEGRRRLAENARRQLPARREEFARQFESYVLECVAQGQGAGR